MRLSMSRPTPPVRDRGGGCTGLYNAILPEGRAFDQVRLRLDFMIYV